MFVSCPPLRVTCILGSSRRCVVLLDSSGPHIMVPRPGTTLEGNENPEGGEMKEEMTRKERTRSAAKGWLSRSAKALATELQQPDVTCLELEDAIEDFDKRLSAFDDAQSAVELEIEDPKIMEKDIEDADQFRRQVRTYRLQAAQKLADLSLAKGKDKVNNFDGSVSGSAESILNNIKLPRIELPKFSGNVLEWQSYWEQFEALVGEANIPDITKFGYLHSSLEGEAKRVIKGLTLIASNYPTAYSVLKERFDKPERIIFAHVQELLGISMPGKSTGSKYITSLWKLHDQLNSHVRS